MFSSLTSTQAKVLAFLEAFHTENGHSPTTQEVAHNFAWSSPSSAQQHLDALEKKGHIARTRKKARSIRILKPLHSEHTSPTVNVPLVGRIAAGLPVFALEEVEEVLSLPKSLFRGERMFALRVAGNSMINAGIFDGDIAILDKRAEFYDGEIAAVIIEEEATLKRIFRSKEGVVLKAENPSYDDRLIRLDKGDLSYRLAGVLLGTIRKFS